MAGSLGPPDVRALFQQRVAGDDALLRLANLRFRQGGMPAEVYADNPDHLEHLLGFVPEHRTLPVVHLNRSANLLDVSGRSLVEAFASRFAGRVAGLVVHDKGDMVDRFPEVVDEVQAATGTALPAVLRLTETIGAIGKPVHFHLHDGHPLVPGLSDHFSFLTRVPVPFPVAGRYALPSMFGPAGLADVLRTAVRACPPGSASFTLEIHQVEGRLPLADATDLFAHWRDLTNAERMNYWLTVLADNHLLAVKGGGTT